MPTTRDTPTIDKTRVWVFHGPRSLRLEERALAEPARGEVRMRVARVGICGSDLHGYTGESGLRKPGVVMGHEATGVIDGLGEGVDGFAIGDRVTFAPTLPCDGRCGHTEANRCEHMRLIGVTPGLQGAFADFVNLPANRVFPLGDVSLDRGSSIEPLAVGLHSARQAGVSPGDSVLVIGGGMIGIAGAIAARLEGATSITVSDPMESRRRAADEFGFNAVAPNELEGLDYFDCAIDAVGIPATLGAAIRAVKRGGIVSLVGLGIPHAEFTLYDLVGHERVIVGSSCYSDSEFVTVIDALASGRIDLTPLAAVQIEFPEVGDALEALATGREDALKVTMSTGVS
jgi:L-iditol 2-dehydrogenase